MEKSGCARSQDVEVIERFSSNISVNSRSVRFDVPGCRSGYCRKLLDATSMLTSFRLRGRPLLPPSVSCTLDKQ